MRARNCALCLKAVRPGEGIRAGWMDRWYCGESCKVADDHRHGHAIHYVPDPRYHRVGDGWRAAKRWVRATVKRPK